MARGHGLFVAPAARGLAYDKLYAVNHGAPAHNDRAGAKEVR
jgi:hypothetical protein